MILPSVVAEMAVVGQHIAVVQADLAALTERGRRRLVRWFRLARLLDARPSFPAPWATRPARRYERRRPEKTPLHKIVSENLERWLAWRQAAERPVPGHVEEKFRGRLL